MKQSIAYIINPVSGTSNKNAIAKQVEQDAKNFKVDCAVYYTRYAGDASERARQFANEGFDKVVAVGGDGTVNEVAQGLIKSRSALGIIPLGSGNGLARHLKIPFNYRKANAVIMANKIINADYGLLNGHAFFCTAGIGFDARVGERFAAAGSRGFATYAKVSFKEFFRYRPETYTINIDGQSFSRRAFLITFANASQWGYNAYISPEAKLDDGLLDMVVVSPFMTIKAPLMGLRMFTRQIYGSRNIEVFRCREAQIQREKCDYVHLDGDSTLADKILNVKTVAGELKIVLP
jgi:YegS/Rv2252/BmrU family lipid kinase